jgi:hypothetical protein
MIKYGKITSGKTLFYTLYEEAALAMPQKKNIRERVALYAAQFGILLVSYGLFLKKIHFSIDSYLNYYDLDVGQSINGRYLWQFLMSCLKKLDINPVVHYRIFTVLLVAVFAWAACRLTRLYIRAVPDASALLRVTIAVAACLTFCNVFFWEWFTFPEAIPSYACCIVLTIWATECQCRGLALPNILAAVILVALGMVTYQIGLPLFVIWCVTSVLLKYRCKLGKQAWCEIAAALFSGGMGTLLASVVPKLLAAAGLMTVTTNTTAGRSLAQMSAILTNVRVFVLLPGILWLNGGRFLPLGFPLLMGVIAFALFWKLYKGKRRALIGLLAVFIGIYLMALLPNIMTAATWYPPRTLVGHFSFWAAIWICLALCAQNDTRISRWVLGLTVIFLLVNIVNIWGATQMQYVTNQEDEEYAQMVEAEIEKYEAASGEEVTTIYFRADANESYQHSDRGKKYSFGGTNSCAAPISWALLPMIRYYTGQSYDGGLMSDEKWQSYFGDAEYSEFIPEEQMRFEGDTCYLLVY